MTPEQVRERVETLRAISGAGGDDEGCHAAEDELHADVLRAIARGAANPAELADEALKTEGLFFHRWYA